MNLDFTKPSSQLIIDLINTKAKRPLLAEEIVFGEVSVNTDESKDRNSTVDIVPSGVNENLVDGATLFYDRIDLQKLFEGNEEYTAMLDDDVTDAQVILTEMNKRFGLGFSNEDFDMNSLETTETTASLTALPGGFVYTGVLTIMLANDNESLKLIMGDGLLDGFETPELNPLLLDVTEENNSETQYVGESGNLLVGSGNPAGAMVVSSNSEIELSLGARITREIELIEPTDGVYAVPLPDDRYWIFPINVAVPETSGAVADLYDVTLTAQVGSDAKTKSWKLVAVDGTQIWKDTEGSEDITDNAVSAAGNIVSNIQAVNFYPSLIEGEVLNSANGQLGTTTIELKAQRKNTLAPTVVATIEVESSAL